MLGICKGCGHKCPDNLEVHEACRHKVAMLELMRQQAIGDGGPAFPNHAFIGDAGPQVGMSLRDWFAGQAINGFLASGKAPIVNGKEMDFEVACFIVADAMVAARNKPSRFKPREDVG